MIATTARPAASVPVLLRRRVVVMEGLAFDAEREVALPIQPFVGLVLHDTRWIPPGCEGNECKVEEVAYDLKTGQLICYLPKADYRPEESGCDWTEDQVREHYQDWKLTRDEMCRPK